MKKAISLILSIVMMLSITAGMDISAFAAPDVSSDGEYISDYCGDDVGWQLNKETGVLTISGSGNTTNYKSEESPFFNRTDINEIIISQGITSIGDNLFQSCKNLKEIVIPDSVNTIGTAAFSDCSGLQNISIPDTVVNIGNSAFSRCTNLISVKLPNNLNRINNGLFVNCKNLKNINIPSKVTSIGLQSFIMCSSLVNIEIPNSVENIEKWAFAGCSGVKKIVISNGRTSIQDLAFTDCSSLEKIILSDSIKSIAETAFRNCTNLRDILFLGSKSKWNSIAENSNPFNELTNATIHYFDKEITKPASCVETGIMTYTSQTYSEMITETIPKTGHNIVIDCAKSETCTETGLTEGSHCSVCDAVIKKQGTTPATGHKSVTDKAVNATCTKAGLTEGSHCSVCNEVLVKQENIPIIPHKYKSSVVQATADSRGYTTYTCSTCGDTYNADYFDAATVYSDFSSATAGSTIRVPISIKNNTGILGWKLTFDYDTDVLTPISVDYGEVISGGIQDNIEGDMIPGSINVYWAGSDNEDYNGVMFYINFEVNKSAVGNTKIDITYSPEDTFDTDFNDVYLDCQPINLSITNNAYLQYAKINASADDVTAGDDLQLKLNISEINSVTKTNVTVDYNADNFEFKSVSSVNGITVKNTDNNGRLTLDISGITSAVNDTNFVTVTFKCKDKAMSGDYNFSVSSADKGIICKGCAVKVKPSATSEVADIYADDVTAKYNDEITIPIYIDNNHGIMGYRLDFKYDKSLLQPISTTCGANFSKNGQFNDSIGVKDGEFKVLWNNVDEKYANGILLNLKFKVLTNEKVDTVISMTYSQPDTFNEKYEDVVFNCKNINVSLNNHQHSYTAVVTAPTCTEKGYTTYTCSCGDSYIDDETAVLGHNYGQYVSNNDATYESDGTKTAVCSRCGAKDTVVDEGSKLVKEPDLTNFKIDSASLTLQNSIRMNFLIKKSNLNEFENPYVVFECEGVNEITTVTEYTEQGDYYVFSFPGIYSNMMNNKVTATLFAIYKENGKEYSSASKSLSVKEYCYKVLNAYASINTAQVKKLKTLIVDLLNYGAASQVYTNTQIKSLVNADLTDVQKSWGTAETPELVSITNKNYKTIPNPTSSWSAAALSVKDSVKVTGTFTAENIENVTVKITCAGKPYEYTKDDFTVNSNGSYSVICGEIKASQMSEEILMTVYDNGVQCSNTLRFSIESYAYVIHNSAYAGSNLDNLTQAMMRYGKSAEAYIA